MKLQTTGKEIEKRFLSFLTGKPIWAWWISYVLIIGILFGVFYVVLKLLTAYWWAIVILIVVAGIIWGTVAFMNAKPAATKEKAEKK